MPDNVKQQLENVSDVVWELPRTYKASMRVPGRIYATEDLLEGMESGVLDQTATVAMLPGIQEYSFCLPDAHWGYGFPIGGAAAVDAEEGVISPGGIGFDINCGMRLLRTDLTMQDVEPYLDSLMDALYKQIPAGLGRGALLKVSRQDFKQILEQGAEWCIQQGYGWDEDLDRTEEGGCMPGADAKAVSTQAVERGLAQVGTLGSGNHYLEIQRLTKDNTEDKEIAPRLGLDRDDQIVVMFHCGSRGFGHQVASDYLESFVKNGNQGGTDLGKEMTYAPIHSKQGRSYYAAMACAVNMAFANRQMIAHRVRQVFGEVFGRSPADLGLRQIYDVCHNTAKFEKHNLNNRSKDLLVHRKGATRAFGPGHPELPDVYRDTGQPVIIGGSMETGSYLLTGTQQGGQTFFTTAHGSGRTMSRRKAKKKFHGDQLLKEMNREGIHVRSASKSSLAEEAGGAYKSVDEVVNATEQAGLSHKIARFTPVGCMKG